MDDSQIVDNILKQHDTRLFGVLVEKYSGLVFSKAMGITHNKELSAEITQQTFIKAYMNLDAWNRGNSLAPWLSVISAHIAISLLDKMKRQQASDVCEDIADEPYDDEHEQQLCHLHEAIKLLPSQDREIIRLHYYQKLKAHEIAKKLRLTPANVLMKLHRIREKRKQQLKAHDHEQY